MLRQIKLTNGEEIICNIVDGGSKDSETDELLISHCLRLTKVEFNKSISYHSFRPWLIMKDDVTDIISLNGYHIVAMAIPSEDMKQQWKNAVKEFKEMESDRRTYSMDEWMDRLERNELEYNDSGQDNVVSLYDYNKDKLH
jgi:hypothetical protein|tara:strand:+ start:393 stop:815 length:423 start_codon:yes stop_codon:yes gene_type:complete